MLTVQSSAFKPVTQSPPFQGRRVLSDSEFMERCAKRYSNLARTCSISPVERVIGVFNPVELFSIESMKANFEYLRLLFSGDLRRLSRIASKVQK